MVTDRSLRTAAVRALALAAILAAAPLWARAAAAQRSGHLQVGAFVVGAVQAYSLHADSAAAPLPQVQRLRIAGVGSLDINCGPGVAIRFASFEADRPTRVVQVTVDYVAN